MTQQKKICSPDKGCGLEKDVGEFHKKRDGYNYICKECRSLRQKQYYQNNPEKFREKDKRYYLDNLEKVKERKRRYYLDNLEKEKERRKRYRLNNPEKEKERKKRYRQSNIEKIMLSSSIHRARQKGIEHNITLEDTVIPEYCPVLGIKLQKGEGGQSHNSPSLDRIDNSKGYIKGNVRVISWRANNIKSNATVEELEKVLRYMREQSVDSDNTANTANPADTANPANSANPA